MRIVPDTNLLVAHLLGRRSASAEIVHLWREGRLEFGMSRPLLAEIRSIIAKPYMQTSCRVPAARIQDLLDALWERSVRARQLPRLTIVRDDPSDNILLATAAATAADYVVTNDRHLLHVRGYENVEVITPGEFLRRHPPEGDGPHG
ncbi:putative toxin-antitoxin system toxin component, PIN family [bacterium]|nr:putative toxin-antitoxin system toxin component, PIN family [bacterium]